MSGVVSLGSRVYRGRANKKRRTELGEFELNLAGVEIEYGTAVASEKENYFKDAIEVTTYTVAGRRSSISSEVSDDEDELGMMPKAPQLTTVQKWKKRIFTLFDEPQSSVTAMFIAGWIMLLILMSTVTFCMESLPSTRTNRTEDDVFATLETVAVAHFTVEYLVRLLTAADTLAFVVGPLNLVDLLAILPYYIELIIDAASIGSSAGVSGLAVIRVIRLARVFRIFKFSKYSTGFMLVGKAMKKSTDALYLMVFLVGIAMIVFASGMYFAEQSGSVWDPNEGVYGGWVYVEPFGAGVRSGYQSIPDSFYWCIVTLTTVGYGDAGNVPITPVGKLVASITMLAGVIIIAFPITIIGTNFDETWTESKQAEKQKQLLREKKLLEFEKTIGAEVLDEERRKELEHEVMESRLGRLMNYKVDADNRTDEILEFLESTEQAFKDMQVLTPMFQSVIQEAANNGEEHFDIIWKRELCEKLFPQPYRPELSEHEIRRYRLFQLFDDPHSSKGAMAITVWIMVLIFVSTITFCVETLPQNHMSSNPIWFVLETIAVANFTIEYLVRLFTCPNVLEFVPQPLNLIDLFAILPYYIELSVTDSALGGGFAVIRVIRLARVFRIFKVSKYARGFVLVGRAMKKSTDALKLLVFLLGIAIVVFASAMYYAEGSITTLEKDTSLYIYQDGTVTPFQSIPDSFWWALVTMTTVGYGDNTPLSPWGKAVAVVCMLSGILILAFPITVIGSAFAEVWDEEKSEQRSLRESKSVRMTDLPALVDKLQTMQAQFRPEVLQELVPFFLFNRTMFGVAYQLVRASKQIANYDPRYDVWEDEEKENTSGRPYGPNFPIPE